VDGAAADPWSAIAEEWAVRWGRFAEPSWDAVLAAATVRPGDRVLDVGCGSGELLAHLDDLGLHASGIDPAPGMVARARAVVPAADVRLGGAERLPWPDGTFDLVVAVNAVQLAEDTGAAVAELLRVAAPGGRVAVAGWAEAARNDLGVIEAAVALVDGDEPGQDGELRLAGGLERLLGGAGLEIASAGLVEVPWSVDDDEALVHGILLGEDAATIHDLAPTVLDAARPFRRPDGGYRLVNHFRHAVGRRLA
jgi:SAM-dependent methyltransferase